MNNFDLDMFKKLDTYESSINTDRLWASIEPALPKPTRRKLPVGLWWFLGASVCVGAYLFLSRQTPIENQLKVVASNLTVPGQEVVAVGQEQSLHQVPVPVSHAAAVNTQQAENGQENVQNTMQSISAESKPSTQQSPKEVQASSTPSKVLNPENQTLSTQTLNLNSQSQLALQSQIKSEQIGQYATRTNGSAKITTRAFGAETHVSQSNHLGKLALTQLPITQPQLLAQRQAGLILPKRPDPQTACYDWQNRHGRIRPYVGIYGGGHMPIRSLASKEPEFDVLAAQRKDTEQVLEAVNGGVFAGLETKRGISLDAGFDYMRINEKFRGMTDVMDTLGQVVTVGVIVNAPGDTTFINDTVNVIQTTTTQQTIYNKYNFYNVPIALGFSFKTKSAVTPHIKAGVLLSVGASQKVGMLDATGQTQIYRSQDSRAGTNSFPFRNRFGASPFVQVGARVRLGGALEAFGEARYMHMTKDVTSQYFQIAQRYKTIGLQLGLRLGL
jgi:hypothetical protein